MYAFIDQSVDRLSDGSRFILWAMRGWVRAASGHSCPPTAISPAFAKMGALMALPDVYMMMALLNRDGLEKLSFAELGCQKIAEDEAVLLELWRDAWRGRSERICSTLALLVDADSVDAILAALVTAAAKLSAVGLAPSGVRATPASVLPRESQG